MDPNSQNPQGDNSAVGKLEKDLQNLTEQAGVAEQPVPVVPPAQETQQVPEITPAVPMAPTLPPVPVEPNVPAQETPKKGSPLMVVAIVLALVAVLAVAAYVFGAKLLSPQPTLTPTPLVVVTPSPTPDVTANWKTYTNPSFGYSIKYPIDWTVWAEGPTKDAWEVLSSPDRAPKGSQEPQVGMEIQILVSQQPKAPSLTDLQQFESTNGVLKHYKVDKISENLTSIQGNTAFSYEYEGTDPSYLFHFWGVDVARGNNIVSVTISSDPKMDPTLDITHLAPQILSTFEFTEATASGSPIASPTASPSSTPIATP